MGIQVPPDSTGKVVETNSPDGATQRQVVTLGDKTTAANVAAVSAAGALRIDPTGTTVQPVSGTFWQTTQPVSIATMPSTPVTGTFWQSTQPVSIATMPSTPVTGTFWQATQPVSGTVSAAVTTQVGAANVATGQVSVTTSATSIAASRATRRNIVITNLSTSDIYLGLVGVTTSTGQLLLGTKGTSISVPINAQIYGIVASGTASVTFMEVYD